MRRLAALLTLTIPLWAACEESESQAPGGNPPPDSAVAVSPDAGSVTMSDAGATPGPTAAQLPCDVKSVLDTYCTECHAAGVPQFGAPMSLATLSDLKAVTPLDKKPAYLAASDRIQRNNAPGMMPPSPRPRLPEAASATLLAWINAGAPEGQACVAPTSDAGVTTDGGPVVGSDAGPVAEEDCEASFELRAHNGPGTKFKVPLENDHYECFYFKANVEPGSLATSMSPLLDDTRVLHHWLLFAAPDESEARSGTHALCDGIHPQAYLMASWLPGTPALVMPKDVGMEMPKGSSPQYILENHYNNTARYNDSQDSSGVKVCTSKKPKAQLAAIHWLGGEQINLLPNSPGSVSATCTPRGNEPVHILGVIPHMHRLGRHVKMNILRANGTTEVMHDNSFAFEEQTYYPKNVVLNPGDRVSTKCDYMNDTSRLVTLGESTTNEMCYMFTLAYPVGSMNTGGDFINPLTLQPYVQGPNRCMR